MSLSRSQFEIVTDPDAFCALQSEWDALWARAHGRYHQAFAVCWLCWRISAQPRGRRLHCIVCREHGKLVMVWPLVTYRFLFWTLLRPLSPDTADPTSILVDEQIGNAAIIEDTLRAVMRSCGAHVCDLPYVSEGSPLYDIADQQPHAIVSERTEAAIAKLRGEADWDAFCATLGTLSGRKPGARERRLSKEGKLEVRMLSPQDTGDYAAWVDWLLARKREWIDRSGKRGDWLASLAYRDFLLDMLDPPAGDAMARLFVLTLDGAPLAASVVGIGESCLTGLIAAFDQRYSKYSPISIVIEHCVKWALEQGKDLDFGVGSESFKAYWSRDNITRACSFRIARSHWGVVGIHTQEMVRRVRTRAPQWQWRLRQIKPQAGARLEPLVQSFAAYLNPLGGLTKSHLKSWHHRTPLHDHHRVER